MALSLLTAPERKLLIALLRTDAAVSGRALARMTELSQPTAQRALVRLRESGLVVTEDAPPALLYRANREHVAMPAVRDLLDLADRLRQRAGQELAAWAIPPVSAV
jgi:predicted nucleotidyltransferase